MIRELNKITAHAYSENRHVDEGQAPRKLVWMLVFAYIITALSLILIFLSLDQGPYPGLNPDNLFIGLMLAMLFLGAAIATSVMIMNFFAKDIEHPSYKQRLAFYL